MYDNTQYGEGSGAGDPDPLEKSQLAIGFLRNTDKDPLEKQFDPLMEIRTALCEIRR